MCVCVCVCVCVCILYIGIKLEPKAYCRFGEQVVLGFIVVKQAATDPFARNSIICTTPSITDPSRSTLGTHTHTDTRAHTHARSLESQLTMSINGKLNEFSNAIVYRYSAQRVKMIIPETGRANARAMSQMLTVRGTDFVDSSELTCFFTPTKVSVHDAIISGTRTADRKEGTVPPGSLRLATKAQFLNSENVICPIPSAWEYPLKCTCKCPGAVCGTTHTRTNLSRYEFPPSAPWSPAAVSQAKYMESDVSRTVETCSKDMSFDYNHPTDRTTTTQSLAAVGWGCQVQVQASFLKKVIYILTLYCSYTRALTFENL